MIAFLSLFLGLIAGPQVIELSVTGEVARVEIFADGESLGVLSKAPWRLPWSPGQDLSPHHLSAVGWDSAGREIARAGQWVNLPRPRRELRLLLDGVGGEIPRYGSLLWGSVDALKPEAWALFFDGVELTAANPALFELPAFSADQPHLLRAEARFGDEWVQAETVVGGLTETATTNLMAVPLDWTGKGILSMADLQGKILTDDGPLRVVAVDSRVAAEVVMVQDLAATLQGRLRALRDQALSPRFGIRRRPSGLKPEDRFRLLVPIPAPPSPKVPSTQFPMSPDLWKGGPRVYSKGAASREREVPLPAAQGLMAPLPAVTRKAPEVSGQRLADAVAAAAVAAAGGRRGRAVVLVIGGDEMDHSRFSPRQVRDYLQRLQVSLFVWSPTPKSIGPEWGGVQNIASPTRLYQAIRQVRNALDQQVLVWVEGAVLPQEIRLGKGAPDGLSLLVSGLADAAEPSPSGSAGEAR